MSLELFEHIYIDNKANKTLFLLHGTGGGKSDFIFLDKLVDKKYNLVGLQGNIDENGMLRFFRRLSINVFDQNSIKEESRKLKEFINAWIKKYKIKINQLYFLGYSNGANILLASLFYYPELMNNVILLRPILPFKIKEGSVDLSNCKIFLSRGKYDQMISDAENIALIQILSSCKTVLIKKEYDSDHQITGEEIEGITKFLKGTID